MIVLKFIILTLLSKFTISLQGSYKKNNSLNSASPLILIPGDGGSRSYSNIDYHVYTTKRLVWVNFEYMLFPSELNGVFKLIYNPETHTTTNAPYSDVIFPGWGSTEMIEDLDEWKHYQTTYFAPLVQELMKDKYYIRNKTLRGAPYDFRKAPNENQYFVPNMKLLIEETYKMAGNVRVVLLGHSLGSLYTLYFLERMTFSWKKQFIRSFVAVSAPLGGAVKAVTLETTGAALGSPRSPLYFRDMQRSFPSTAFLLPVPKVFGTKPIIITPKKNYSAYDYESFFKDMNFPQGSMMYNDTKNLLDRYKSPEGIDELYCIHGYGNKTDEQLLFTNFPDDIPHSIEGYGDNTVNIQSLELCKMWSNVNYHTIDNADHMGIISNEEFVCKLKQILYQQPTTKFKMSSNKDVPKENLVVRVF